MNPGTALDAARRAHKRRRAMWAGGGAGLAVITLAAGAVFALSPGAGTTLPVDPASAVPTGEPSMAGSATEKTQPTWPDGQVDRTATSGPRAAKGDTLLNALGVALPDTLTIDKTLTYAGSDSKITSSQSQFVDYIGADKTKQIWEYLATIAVHPKTGQGTGRVFAQVHTAGNTNPVDVCELAKSFWGVGGTCQVREIQGKKVGVVTKSDDSRIDQTAAYRYDDGTVVWAAQSKEADNLPDGPDAGRAMAEPPLPVDQLATLVLNPAFKLD